MSIAKNLHLTRILAVPSFDCIPKRGRHPVIKLPKTNLIANNSHSYLSAEISPAASSGISSREPSTYLLERNASKGQSFRESWKKLHSHRLKSARRRIGRKKIKKLSRNDKQIYGFTNSAQKRSSLRRRKSHGNCFLAFLAKGINQAGSSTGEIRLAARICGENRNANRLLNAQGAINFHRFRDHVEVKPIIQLRRRSWLLEEIPFGPRRGVNWKFICWLMLLCRQAPLVPAFVYLCAEIRYGHQPCGH